MKNRKFGFVLLLMMGISFLGCKKEVSTTINNIGEVKSIFELKYGETKDITIGNKSMKISLKDVIDSLIVDCSLVDFIDNSNGPDLIKIHALLQIDNHTQTIKVSSRACGALTYNNDDNDISQISDTINTLKETSHNLSTNYYTQEFQKLFAKGTKLDETQYTIYLAKAYPMNYNKSEINKTDYKFIFIITD